jgi:hypothetical protein
MSDLPPPGWYDDPTDPTQERWWDGTMWSDQTRRRSGEVISHQPGELRSIGDFVNHTATLLRARWDDFLLVAVIAGVMIGMAGVALLRPILQGVDIINEEFVGWQASYAYQLGAFTVVAGVASLVTVLACFRLAWGAATNVEEGWATAIQYAIVSSLRFLGWVIVGLLPFVASVFAFVAFARAGIGILGLALFVGLVWWSLVVSFIPVTFVSQPRHTNPIRAAFAIVKGRWWRILGRLMLISFFAGLVFQVISVILSQVLGINFIGFEFVETGTGQFEIVKDLDDALPFFIGFLVMSILSMGSTVAQAAAATAIADDLSDLDAGVSGSNL